MEQSQNYLSEFEEKEKLGTLRTLTILTFIGCGILFILAIVGFAFADKSYTAAQEMVNSGKVNQIPAFFRSSYTPEGIENLRKMAESKVPVFIINVIAIGLCVFGAIQMRKQKADGYWLWLLGELLPFAGYAIFVGFSALTGVSNIFGYAITALFILLYTLQRKNLTK
jgi:hypothetical protein